MIQMALERMGIFFAPGFESIPYDLAKWGGGLLWGELKKRQFRNPVDREIYDLIENTVKEKTGNRLTLDQIAPACELIFYAYEQNGKVSIAEIKEALNTLEKNYSSEEAETWKDELDKRISSTGAVHSYLFKKALESYGNAILEAEKTRTVPRADHKKLAEETIFQKMESAFNRQFVLADNYSIRLKQIDSMLLTDLKEIESGREYFVNENQTALLQKLNEAVQETAPGDPAVPILITGEGGIGKTVTMLETAKQLFQEARPSIYVPLRKWTEGMSLESFIDADILKNTGISFHSVWNFCKEKSDNTILYLFLDGFNELRQNLKYQLLEEIKLWCSYDNVMVIVSSRRTFEEEGCQQNCYQRLCMERLPWERVVRYLKAREIPVPDPEKMSEILGIPLMLKIFSVVEQNEKDVQALSRGCGSWRKDLTSPGNLLWDYIQCQIHIAYYKMHEKASNYMGLITAAEYIAPYLAAQMNAQGVYITDGLRIKTWIKQGLQMLENSTSFQGRKVTIATKYQEAPFDEKTVPPEYLLSLLRNRLNILRIDDEENSGMFSFEHQDFQDILHYIYIESGLKQYQEPFYQGAFNHEPLHFDLITRMSEMMNEEQIEKLWQDFHTNPGRWGEYGISNIVELLKRKRHNDLSEVDFSGLDLRNTKLSGSFFSHGKKKACFKGAKIGIGTFTSEGHSATVDSLSFNNTGAKFVSASYDKLLRIWDTYDGKRLADFEGHSHYVRCVSWSPDGKTIVSGGDDQELFVWDAYAKLEQQKDRHQMLADHKGWIYCVDWACDGKRFASGDSQGVIFIWNYKYGGKAVQYKKIQAHSRDVKGLAWSPIHENVFASSSSDGEIKLWCDGAEVFCLEKTGSGVPALGWSPDGKMLAAGIDRMLYIWNIDRKENRWRVSLVEQTKISEPSITRIVWTNYFIAFAAGKALGILSLKGIYGNDRIWNQKAQYPVRIVFGHKSQIQGLAWSEQEKKLITGADDSSIRIWKARNPLWNSDWSCVCAIEGASLPVRCVAWSENSRKIVAGYDDNALRKWDIAQERCTGVFKGHDNRVKCVDWKGNRIASGSNDGVVRVWDTETEECLKLMDQHKGAVNCVQWFSDGKRIVSGSDDHTLIIWNYLTDEKIRLEGHDDRVYCLALSPNEQILASGSNDRTIRFWNTQTGGELKEMNLIPANGIGHKAQIRALAWSCYEDFPVLASGSNDKTVICWKQDESGKWKQARVLTGHDDFVYCLSWCPKSSYLVSGSTDNTLWIWNAETGEKIYRMTEHTNYAHGVSWSPNGMYIASASCDGSVIIWNVEKLPEAAPIHKLIAINAIDIRGCDFAEAEFETAKLKELIQMNGGEVDA